MGSQQRSVRARSLTAASFAIAIATGFPVVTLRPQLLQPVAAKLSIRHHGGISCTH
jgi:hypothetical protein